VTWIAPAHIENLGSLTAIAEEKGDIFAGLEDEGVAIVPNEAPEVATLLAAAERGASQIIRFGREAGCEARLLSFTPDESGAIAEADVLGRQIRYRVGAPGAHWALNTLAALAAADAVGVDVKAAAHALEGLQALDGRGLARRVEAAFGPFTLIDDAYNANPASMTAAFESLAARRPDAGGRRIVALGDMLELGVGADAYHAGLAGPLQASGVDQAFLAGAHMRALWEALPESVRGGYAESAEALCPLIADGVRAGDVVLVKGSKGSRMGRVVDALSRLAAS
jgi:UDP-N-acetylmuramoyl-tripeptide--D-alanyl-D-alanine ligase